MFLNFSGKNLLRDLEAEIWLEKAKNSRRAKVYLVEIDQFLSSCTKEELRTMYEKINQLLSADFVPQLPVECTDMIFTKLSCRDLCTAAKERTIASI